MRRVLRRDLDLVDADAELRGDELREDRLGALAHLRDRGEDRGSGRRRSSSTEATDGQLDLAGAGEPGAVPGEREPDARRRPVRRSGAPRGHDAGAAAAPGSSVVRARTRSNSAASAARSRTSLAGDALAQDLAGRGRIAEPVDVAAPHLERAQPERLGEPVRSGSPPRTPSAAPRSRGTRRWVACSSRVARPRIRTFGQRYGPPAWSTPRRQDDGGERAVGAAVHDDLDVLGDERPVARDAGPVA